MTYNVNWQEVVLFGGREDSVVRLIDYNDTWVWDGLNWTQKFPPTSPPPRAYPGMAYDAVHEEVVVFGGESCCALTNNTWVWDGLNWTQKFPATSPISLQASYLAYDSIRAETVLFPAWPQNEIGTWVWDGNNWIQKQPISSPRAQIELAMVYDDAHQQVVLYGGLDPLSSPSLLGETWIWGDIKDSTGAQFAFPELLRQLTALSVRENDAKPRSVCGSQRGSHADRR